MTDPVPEPEPYAWLPADRVLAWCKVDAAGDAADVVEVCRLAAADYVQTQRPDLFTDEAPAVGSSIVMAGVLAASRLYARRNTPMGVASFGEFGATDILRLDPDVTRLLGVGRHARPTVG